MRRRVETSVVDFRRSLASRFSGHMASVGKELSLIAWGQRFLPHYFVDQPSGMHRWIADEAAPRFDKRGQKIAIVGPRGGAKSTTGTLTLPMKRALEGRETYILICSDTTSQAVEHLKSIKEELESNERIAEHYPHAAGEGPVWKQNQIQMRNGCVIRAVGTLSRIRGLRRKQHRPSLIILDDPENDEHISSTTMRERTWSWLNRTLMNMGTKDTNYMVMGTAIHREGLVLRLLRTPGWRSFRPNGLPAPFKAIVEWPTRMDMWQEWENIYYDVDKVGSEKRAKKFYESHRKEMNEGASVLWPAREPLYQLMMLRAEVGHQSFEGEKQGNPINPETCEWPEEYFGEHIWFDEWPSLKRHAMRIITLDPSKGKDSRRGDYSSICKLVVDDRGVGYHDFNIARRSTDTIVDDFLAECRKFRPHKVGIETNQFQQLLAEDIRNKAAEQHLDIDIVELDNRVNKNLRIRRMSPLFAAKRMKYRRGSKGNVIVIQQHRDFPNGDHDDGPDSEEMAWRIYGEYVGGTDTFDDGLGDELKVVHD